MLHFHPPPKLLVAFFNLLMAPSLKAYIDHRNYSNMPHLTIIWVVGYWSPHFPIFFHVMLSCSFWNSFQKLWNLKHEYNDVLSQIGLFQFSYEFSRAKILIVGYQDLTYFLKIGVTYLSFVLRFFFLLNEMEWLMAKYIYIYNLLGTNCDLSIQGGRWLYYYQYF